MDCAQLLPLGLERGCRSWSWSRVYDQADPALYGHLPRPQVLGVITIFEKMGCKTVAQSMGCDMFVNIGRFDCSSDGILKTAGVSVVAL